VKQKHQPVDIPESLDLDDPEQPRVFLRDTRAKLKIDLFYQRGFYSPPVCPICMNAVVEPSLHEVLLTRNTVQRSRFDVKVQIHVAQNCVLIHDPDCHRIAQHTSEGKIACIKQLIEYEGYNNILSWLEYMDSITTLIAGEPILLLNSIEADRRCEK